jgi:REP element-mobilizing transposase RayT
MGMARHLRIEFPGAIYHVTSRMLGDRRLSRSRLFVDDADRERFVDRLGDRVNQYNIRLYLFVCMTNHFHLVFETPEANCSRFMQSLSTAYTVYYNLRHARHGHLLDGRYKAKVVEGNNYLLALTRYVHLNPVQRGAFRGKSINERIRYLRHYRWSSYSGYLNKRRALEFMEYAPILAQMRGKRREWRRRYRQFVESGLAEDDLEFKEALNASPRSIGSDGFRSWIDDFHHRLMEGCQNREDISFRRVKEPLPAETILKTLAKRFAVEPDAFHQRRRNSPLRAVAAQMLIRFGGQTQREVAVLLDLGTGGAVSAQVRKLPRLLSEDRQLRLMVRKAEEQLSALKQERNSPSNKKTKRH